MRIKGPLNDYVNNDPKDHLKYEKSCSQTQTAHLPPASDIFHGFNENGHALNHCFVSSPHLSIKHNEIQLCGFVSKTDRETNIWHCSPQSAVPLCAFAPFILSPVPILVHFSVLSLSLSVKAGSMM